MPSNVVPSCCCPCVCPVLCPVVTRASLQESLLMFWATYSPLSCRRRVFSVLEEEVQYYAVCAKGLPLLHTINGSRTTSRSQVRAGVNGTDDVLLVFGRPACRSKISVNHVATPEDTPACEAAVVHCSRQRNRVGSKYPSITAGSCRV